nr:molybdenum cofactor guanylyltransferase [Candidatus Sigynarchaeum springense]MDO8116213.1 molybdenum cofactor guanylyltransferase [Candidatus Sigynarchaeota archaeon]
MYLCIGILAGGRSTRFGSNKCLFKIEGETLIAKTLSSISTLKIAPNRVYISLYKESQVAELLPHLSSLVFKDDHRGSAYLLRPPGDPGREIPVEFVFDEERPDLPENRAAIWGIMRVLQEVPAGYVQIIPCDTPFFNADVINALHEELEDLADAAALVPRWKNGYIEPLHTIYNKEAMIEKIKINVDRRNFKLRNLFEGCHSVKFFDIEEKLGRIDPSHKAFKNLNNLDDLSG